MLKTREPWVAGRWYPSSAPQLRADLSRYCACDAEPQDQIAVVAPHAGFMFSGHTAGQVFARTRIPRRVIMLGPKHTRLGAPYAILPEGLWRTPLGEVRVDDALAQAIMDGVPELEISEPAHRQEHALEAHLPFVQFQRSAPATIVPIVMTVMRFEDCVRVGEALASIIKAAGEPVLLAASTDMSHFISADAARELDMLAIERIKALDPEGLYQVVFDREITMCGVIPTTITLVAANALGASRCELIEYTHSGVVSGDYGSVVGYAGLTIA